MTPWEGEGEGEPGGERRARRIQAAAGEGQQDSDTRAAGSHTEAGRSRISHCRASATAVRRYCRTGATLGVNMGGAAMLRGRVSRLKIMRHKRLRETIGDGRRSGWGGPPPATGTRAAPPLGAVPGAERVLSARDGLIPRHS